MTNVNVERISDEEMEDMFGSAFETQVASPNEIGSYECTCKRDSSNPDVKMEVTIIGLAGSPTLDDFKEGRVKNSGTVVVQREDRERLKFKLVVKEVVSLNTNDYSVVYKLA